jgi:hypothetical protein
MERRLIHRLIVMVVSVGIATVANAQATPIDSPAQIASKIRARGAAATLTNLYDTEVWSTSISPGIASGSLAWIRIAAQLKVVADGAAAEDLDIALLFGALPAEPLNVLPELTRIYAKPVEDICHVSFEAQRPKPDVASYLLTIRAKLNKARSVQARKMAEACRRGLARAEDDAKTQGVLTQPRPAAATRQGLLPDTPHEQP